MQIRKTNTLNLASPKEPLPSVEIDLDDLPVGMGGYSDLVANALAQHAAASLGQISSIYVYQGQSVNFHQLTWSAFFAVAGNDALLEIMLEVFRSAQIKARFSDYIDPSQARLEFHIEDGVVWRPYEMGAWYTDQ